MLLLSSLFSSTTSCVRAHKQNIAKLLCRITRPFVAVVVVVVVFGASQPDETEEFGDEVAPDLAG